MVPAPSRKLKQFYWDKLPDMKLSGSVWEGLGPAEWLDWEQLEELFAQVRKCYQVIYREKSERECVLMEKE